MRILMLILLLSMMGCSSTPYVKTGVGIIFHETENTGVSCDSKFAGRLEIGVIYKEWVAGWSHKSQPMCGWPVDNRSEIFTDQIFIDKIWTF